MKVRDDKVYLLDILDSIEIIEKYTAEVSLEEFEKNFMLQDAVIRRFEVIGEAATKISDAFKKGNPEVEWRLISGMRNKLIHEYLGISVITIYNTVYKDLPVLKQKIKPFV
ncbi:MAG TPA: DUF86 domain-containing protein [Chitinophagales bacterium]|nr:DUF86 domain-containing protein [Chitinophagales bacterium]